jgi:hypothetical protein
VLRARRYGYKLTTVRVYDPTGIFSGSVISISKGPPRLEEKGVHG